jgi:hypothetical protein
MRLLISSLFPAHHLSWTEANIGALLPSKPFEPHQSQQQQQQQQQGGKQARRPTTTLLRFSTRITGQTVDWSIESKVVPSVSSAGPSPSVSASPVLFVLRMRSTSGALPSPLLRAMVLRRLHKLLFRGAASSSSSASEGGGGDAPASAASSVNLRKPAPLPATCTPAQLPAAREAQKWLMQYMRASSTPSSAALNASTTPAPVAASSSARGGVAASAPLPPSPLVQHVQQLHSQLLEQRAQRYANASTSNTDASSFAMQLYRASRGGPTSLPSIHVAAKAVASDMDLARLTDEHVLLL